MPSYRLVVGANADSRAALGELLSAGVAFSCAPVGVLDHPDFPVLVVERSIFPSVTLRGLRAIRAFLRDLHPPAGTTLYVRVEATGRACGACRFLAVGAPPGLLALGNLYVCRLFPVGGSAGDPYTVLRVDADSSPLRCPACLSAEGGGR